MRLIRLGGETDFAGWRDAARALVAEGVRPEDVEWTAGAAASLLAHENRGQTPISERSLSVPRAFLKLARSALLHSDPARFGLLYRLLWRLRDERSLLAVASDADVARVRAMSDAVAREIHKTHAFVRFREVPGASGPVYIAWFEPAHYTLEAAAPFFVRRFAALRWSILSPRVSAHWDGQALHFGSGASRDDAPGSDGLEALWRTYYASIFNAARLKTDTMRAHMPRRYWRNLPEAELIGALVSRSGATAQRMIDQPPTEPRRRSPLQRLRRPDPESACAAGAPSSFDVLRQRAQRCTACPLYAAATQTVFGEGPARAELMFVGEQPGDREDIAGRAFVGPAGQLFDSALADAGIVRADAYLTNAVKHFKFEPRGKRRLHKTPGQLEIEACRPWLEHEIRIVQPRLIVALGATAACSVLGKPTPVQKNRGQPINLSAHSAVMVTVHPSYLLRVPEARHAGEYRRFVADLELARAFAARRLSVDAAGEIAPVR